MNSLSSKSSEQPETINVLLIDDSALIRKSLRRLIESNKTMSVIDAVENGQVGVHAAQKHKPDIVILDIEMPVMDGITALPKILEASPRSKVIVFSSLAEKNADVTLKALSLGAVECILKPSANDQASFQKKLLHTIKGLALRKETVSSIKTALSTYEGKPSIIVIGASTGGPRALPEVIQHFANFDVPILVTQHMPPTFTKALAQNIQKKTGIETVEAEDNMSIEKGKVYVAPGGFHMKAVSENNSLKIKLDDGPEENFCKPSIDPMLRSATALFGKKVLGIILTGMGSDGLKSAKELANAGGRIIAQDNTSSVVWGMPGSVAEAGICKEILPLEDIGPWIRKAVLG